MHEVRLLTAVERRIVTVRFNGLPMQLLLLLQLSLMLMLFLRRVTVSGRALFQCRIGNNRGSVDRSGGGGDGSGGGGDGIRRRRESPRAHLLRFGFH